MLISKQVKLDKLVSNVEDSKNIEDINNQVNGDYYKGSILDENKEVVISYDISDVEKKVIKE